MGSKQAFTIEQLQAFQKLMKRKQQVESWQREMSDKIVKLKKQQHHAKRELAEIEARLDGEFADLVGVSEIFSTSAVPDTALSLEETHYVTKDKKEILFKKILADYKRDNPEADKISYTEVKKTLADRYKIKTRSIANFFLGILSEYQTVGGNRNKAIVLPKKI